MRLTSIYCCIVFPVAGLCQKPVINSVVNGASYEAANFSAAVPFGSSIAPGSVATLFGTNLASVTESAATTPLPTMLGGVSVAYNGQLLHLFYVSPSQINFQMSSGGSASTSATNARAAVAQTAFVVVTTGSGASDPYPLPFSSSAAYSDGVFTSDSSGCGQAAVLNDNPDGSVGLNSPSNSISPGGYISAYGSGLWIPRPPPDGAPTPSHPLETSQADVVLDLQYVNNAVWSGLAPGLIGVDQINVQVPSTVREGCAVPLQILSGDASPPVTISVRNGGGNCIDPPSAGYGQITWQKTHLTTTTGSSESDTLTVSLQASPGQLAPPTPIYMDTNGFGGMDQITFYGPSCPIPGYRSLGAGTVTVHGSGFGPLQASVVPWQQGQASGVAFYPPQQGQASGLTVYQATLPTGAIQPGLFSVNAAGGSDVGAFLSSVKIGSGILVTTPLAGVSFSRDQPLTINWTGGDPNAWVIFQLVSHQPYYDAALIVQVHASDGSVTLPMVSISVNGTTQNSLPGPFGPGLEMIMTVTPDPSLYVPFSASGLSLGGQHTWQYVYRFEDVTIN